MAAIISNLSSLLFICLLLFFYLVNSKKQNCSFCYFYARSPLNDLSIFLKQGSSFLQDHDSMPYQLWQSSNLYPPSCNQYLALICNRGLHFNLCGRSPLFLNFPKCWGNNKGKYPPGISPAITSGI